MNFKHYFNFLGLPEIGKIQISEPFGFDGSSHKVKQDDGRFGRDVVIGNEEIELIITRDHFEIMSDEQILPNGVRFKYASQGFDYVASEIKQKGWECEIEYILDYNGTEFNTGIIDGYTAIVLQDEIRFKIIQNTKREEIKRREDIYVNAFSDKDLDDNTITPCTTTNILLKAKPIFQITEFESNSQIASARSVSRPSIIPIGGGNYGSVDFAFGANNCNIVKNYGVENTLSFLSNTYPLTGNPFFPVDGLNFTFIEALNQLTNIKIDITDVIGYCKQDYENKTIGIVSKVMTGTGKAKFIIKHGFYNGGIGDNLTDVVLFEKEFSYVDGSPVDNTLYNLDSNYSVTIPLMQKGERLYILFGGQTEATFNTNDSSSTQPLYYVDTVIEEMKIKISATSTAIDSVVKGVRLIDLMKHNVKSVGNVPLIAPDYDYGGEHYNNFAFNGYLLGQITDKPFNNRFKDITDITQEICADYQINPDNVEIQTYGNFYKNIEIGAFTELPDSENETIFNKRYFLKEFWLGYNKSSDARQVNGQNTIDDVHTDTQWMFPSKKTDGNLKLNINHSRSAYLIEEARKRATKIEEKTTSLQYDESLFLLDCVELAPGTRLEITAPLAFQVNDLGQLLLLSDGSFNWTLLGFNVGDILIVSNSFVADRNYLVVEYTPNMITLEGIGFVPTGSGNIVFTIDYPITNVQYTNRTNEGFTLIDGVLLGEKYSNLNYSIKRNIQRWFPYLATAGKYLKDKFIKNTLFKVNGELITRKIGELANVVDKEPIDINAIADSKILNPKIHKVSVFCDFDKATQLFLDVRDVKGFVRVQLNTNEVIKGYPKELDYEWSTNKLTMDLEEKYETDFLIINGSGGNAEINGINYIGASFSITNNFVSLYDSQDILISTTQHFTAIELDGVTFTDIDAFSDALILILT